MNLKGMYTFRIFPRLFHTTYCTLLAEKSNKALLAKLRKSTGYTFSNCKKALDLHENDLAKAEAWLHQEAQKQGWDKAVKLDGRKTTQGLIGVLCNNNKAAMVEVNCETDFVARNREFHKLVYGVAQAVFEHHSNIQINEQNIGKIKLDSKEVGSIPWSGNDPKTLTDMVALKIGQVSENITLRRATVMRAVNDVRLAFYTHPSEEAKGTPGSVAVGKYGTLVAFQQQSDYQPSEELTDYSVEDCGRQICQHIVGMNPRSIGSLSDEANKDIEEETEMVHQEFLLDTEITVGNFMQQYGLQVFDYVRYECGENLEEKREETSTDKESIKVESKI